MGVFRVSWLQFSYSEMTLGGGTGGRPDDALIRSMGNSRIHTGDI